MRLEFDDLVMTQRVLASLKCAHIQYFLYVNVITTFKPKSEIRLNRKATRQTKCKGGRPTSFTTANVRASSSDKRTSFNGRYNSIDLPITSLMSTKAKNEKYKFHKT